MSLYSVTTGMFYAIHWENYTSISLHIEWDMIVVTVFLSILIRIKFHLVKNLKENCHHDHIPYSNFKEMETYLYSEATILGQNSLVLRW